MMNPVLLILFSMLSSVQPSLADEYIFPSNGKILYYENSPATFICKNSIATWLINGKKITECNCPTKCEDILFDKTRITSYCNGSSPVLHFKQMKLTDNYKSLRHSHESSWSLRLLVGRRNDDFYPKEPFALINNNYALVCERKNKSQEVFFYDDKKLIGLISIENFIDNFDEENFVITYDHPKITLLIKKVALKDDGKIFGCYLTGNHLSLLNLTVNVPVSSVSLHQESKGLLLENEIGTFVCKVDESKPKASFQWILFENGFEREITQNIDITSKQNGKLWQTNSILKLKLKRNFKTIKCRARIQGMAWTNSTSLPLDIMYPPLGKPIIVVNDSEICVDESIRIRCEWKGGYPNAFINLTCLSKTETKEEHVTITETVTRKMSNHCRCEGNHIAKNEFYAFDLNIQHPPNQVVIRQTSFLKGKPSSLICDVSGGSPDVYTYSWSPGNHPHQKEININLTQVVNQTFTCTVAHPKCNSATVKSSSKKIIVEDFPIIKMPNRITVIENETNELNCISEGNPKPTNEWRIGSKIINSTLLKISFTRQNASGGIGCVAIANSSKHGILKTVQNISIVVTYPPEITIYKTENEIRCSANASPANITYEFVQKWGNREMSRINGNRIFLNFNYYDAGEWICQANNGVRTNTGQKYSEKSIKVKVNTTAKFSCNKIQEAKVGHQKSIKLCFYCHPEAEVVEWHSERRKLFPDKSLYVPAEDGQFPFTGNCSILILDITEESAKIYELKVQNKVGKSNYSLTLDIKANDDNKLVIILSSTIAALFIFIIISAGIICFKYKRDSMKKNAAMKTHPLPAKSKLGDKPTADTYDDLKFDYENLEEQHKGDKPSADTYDDLKFDYENLEEQHKENKPTTHTYLEMLPKEDEPTVDNYDDIKTQQKELYENL